MGWTRLGNGALLRQAAAEFHAVLTADQNIEFQQNLTTLPIAVVVLVANSNRKEYGGLGLDQAKRLKALEQENLRLKLGDRCGAGSTTRCDRTVR